MEQIEHQFSCPYCWENITMLLDLSVTDQDYIEDCEVCCSPIQIYYEADEGSLTHFEAKRPDDD